MSSTSALTSSGILGGEDFGVVQVKRGVNSFTGDRFRLLESFFVLFGLGSSLISVLVAFGMASGLTFSILSVDFGITSLIFGTGTHGLFSLVKI